MKAARIDWCGLVQLKLRSSTTRRRPIRGDSEIRGWRPNVYIVTASTCTPQQIAQGFALDQLHHDVSGRILAACLTEIVNRHDIRVTKHGGGASLAPEALDCICVSNELLEQHLDGHLIADERTSCAVDHAHAAFAESRHEFIFGVEDLADERIAWRYSFVFAGSLSAFGRCIEGERESAVGTEPRVIFEFFLALWTIHCSRSFFVAVMKLWVSGVQLSEWLLDAEREYVTSTSQVEDQGASQLGRTHLIF